MLKDRRPIVVFRYGGPIVWFRTAGEEMLTSGISVTLSWGSRERPGNLVAFEHEVTYFRARLYALRVIWISEVLNEGQNEIHTTSLTSQCQMQWGRRKHSSHQGDRSNASPQPKESMPKLPRGESYRSMMLIHQCMPQCQHW